LRDARIISDDAGVPVVMEAGERKEFPPKYRKTLSIDQATPFNQALDWNQKIYTNFKVSCLNLPYTAVKSPRNNQEDLTFGMISMPLRRNKICPKCNRS
jgi:hypothetical protein